jgi:hypothetical protein
MSENAIIARVVTSVILFKLNPRPSVAAKKRLIEVIRWALREAAATERKAATES